MPAPAALVATLLLAARPLRAQSMRQARAWAPAAVDAVLPTPPSKAAPAAAGERGLAGADLSRDYLAMFGEENGGFDEPRIQALRRDYKVLIVPGFLTNHFPVYFDDQMGWLKDSGIDHEMVAFNTEQTPRRNARAIVRAIESADKPVVIISHSKGSIDALEALLSIPRDELRGKVKGWVELQGTFLGTPVADYVVQSGGLGHEAALLLKALGGTPASLSALTTWERGRYCERNKAAIEEVVAAVPVVAFVSWKDPQLLPNTILGVPRNFLLRRGFKNDGLMPVDNALLPGMDFVKVGGVDHFDPGTPGLQRFDRLRMTRAMLTLLFHKMGVALTTPGN